MSSDKTECPNCGGTDNQTGDDAHRVCWRCGTRWAMSEPDEVEPARIDGEAVDGRVDVTPVGAGAPLDEDQPALRLSIRTDDGAGTVAVELSSADAVALVDEINAELERLQEAAR